MGMVLATAEMLKNDYVRQTGEMTGTNYNEAITALKQVISNLVKISDQRKKHPSFTHPCMALSQDVQQQIPPSTAPIWDSNPVLRTSETQ
eukprot:3827704-Ditylum_brightwellii.AAC.1